MEYNNPRGCRAGLQPGMVVKDIGGVMKQVTRIEGDNVYWRYLQEDLNPAGEMVSDYTQFADSHFLVPRAKPEGKAA